jgi:hypothetical protein
VSGEDAPRPKGPFAPLEMLDEVQRQALDAALRITAELGSLTGGLADASWLRDATGRSHDGAPEDTPPVDVGRLRADVARAADTFSDLLRAVLDVGFDAMDELARRPGTSASGAADPGTTAAVTCAVRNGVDATAGLRAHVPQLASVDGVVLQAPVHVEPERFDLQAHERIELRVSVDLPADAVAGRYHGLVLVSGLPDAAHPITFLVTDHGSGDGRR